MLVNLRANDTSSGTKMNVPLEEGRGSAAIGKLSVTDSRSRAGGQVVVVGLLEDAPRGREDGPLRSGGRRIRNNDGCCGGFGDSYYGEN